MKKLWIFSLLLLVGCLSPNPPEVGIQPWMRTLWWEAQNELSQLVPYPKGNPFSVPIDRFFFTEAPEWFMCGPIRTAGCFYPGVRLIRYFTDAREVIKHEAKHAILWELHDPRWECIEHGKPCP